MTELLQQKSWITTGVGLLVAFVGILTVAIPLFDGNPDTAVDVSLLGQAAVEFLIAGGFIAARDNNKSSEDVGTKHSVTYAGI